MDSLKLLHAWRHRSTRPILARCVIPASFGLLFALGSLAAGVFSSYIVTTTDLEVLVGSGSCRLLNSTDYIAANTDDVTYQAALRSAASSFAQRCYREGPLPSDCNFFIHPRVEPTLSFVECPFDSGLCFNGSDTKAAVLDSGYLDSNDVLGINAPPEDRVLMRRQSTCVPLDTAKYTTLINNSDPIITSIVGNVSLRAYPPPLEESNQWWAVRFGAFTGLSDNVTELHSTLGTLVSADYSYQYV